jgi:hypothetical protein
LGPAAQRLASVVEPVREDPNVALRVLGGLTGYFSAPTPPDTPDKLVVYLWGRGVQRHVRAAVRGERLGDLRRVDWIRANRDKLKEAVHAALRWPTRQADAPTALSRPDAYTPGVQRFGVGGLASIVLAAATVVLVGVPVISGFWSADTSPSATTSTTPPWCRDLLTNHMADVRRLPPQEIRRIVVACDMTYTKECSSAGSTDPRTGRMIYAEPPHCTIRDKHGRVVRTYTTDALRPTP